MCKILLVVEFLRGSYPIDGVHKNDAERELQDAGHHHQHVALVGLHDCEHATYSKLTSIETVIEKYFIYVNLVRKFTREYAEQKTKKPTN